MAIRSKVKGQRLKAGSIVAVAGTSGLVGSRLLAALAADNAIKKIIAIDTRGPRIKNKKIQFVDADIKEGESVEVLGKALAGFRCNTLIHAALPSEPSSNPDDLHELQTAGTMHLLLAAEIANTNKLILSSTTEVYGALPDNPGYLEEDKPLRGGLHSSFINDKIDAERQFVRFQKRFPKSVVTILRPCTIISNAASRSGSGFLSEPTVATVMGFDPLIQFIHINDLIRIFITVIEKDFRGAFNLAGDGVLPLSRALKIAGKTNLPISSFLLYPVMGLLWHLNIGAAPAKHIDFVKYSFVAETKKAKSVLKFDPVYSSEEALLSIKEPPPL